MERTHPRAGTLEGALEAAFGDAEVIVLHAATRALGPIPGEGASPVDRFVAALRAAADGRTLVVPTFSMQCADPSAWPDPPDDLEAARAAHRPDPARTPTGMGRWVERLLPHLARSSHPTESVGAIGPDAARLVAPHPIDDPLGPRSPWARLVAADARVVLLGVGLERCTLLHHAERTAEVPYLDGGAYLVPVFVDGTRTWVDVVGNRCARGFPRLGARLPAVHVPVLGATARVLGARSLHDVARSALAEDPGALLCDECLACAVARDDIAQGRR